MNLNTFARDITLHEGKIKSLSIGQVKEVIKLTLLGLKELTLEELTILLKRIK
jgi:hypothetical protein